MVKKTFIYVVVIMLVAIAGWFFVQKMNGTSDNDLSSIVSNESPTPTPSASPKMENEQSGNWVKLPGGLEYQDVTVGTGREAKDGNVVSANYTGTLADGKKFDSSYDRGQPFSFILGGGMVIKGWDLGLVGMKVGGKRKLIIPPALGYGNKEVGNGVIPANSTLMFDIELVDVADAPIGQ